MSNDTPPRSETPATEAREETSGGNKSADSSRVSIPTPWGPIEGTAPSLLLLVAGSIATYLLLLFIALPQKQPALLVDPMIDVVLTAQPTPLPKTRIVLLDQNHQRVPLTQQQYEIGVGQQVRLLVTPHTDGQSYRWLLSPTPPRKETDAGPFVGGFEENEVTFIAPEVPGTYMVTACAIDPENDTCADDHVSIILVKESQPEENAGGEAADAEVQESSSNAASDTPSETAEDGTQP